MNWWTDSTMTSLISSGASGTPLCVGSAGARYCQLSDPSGRFNSVAASKTVTCGGSDSTTLTVATGYNCWKLCAYPLPNTLYCTFANAGNQTFTYSGGNWSTSFVYASNTYAITLNLSTGETVTATQNGTGFTCTLSSVTCSVSPGFGANITPSGIGSRLATE